MREWYWEKKSRVLQDDEKKVVAYHEVGHAIVVILCLPRFKSCKNFISSRGMSALGYTLQLPTEERFLNSKEELKGQIATLLVEDPEEVVFGKVLRGLQTIYRERLISPNKWLVHSE